MSSSDYVVIPFQSTVGTSIEAYNRANRDAEVVFVWSITDVDDVQVNNGSFSYLVYSYEKELIDKEFPAPDEEGDYVLSIDIPDVQVSGSASYPFRVYSVLGWFVGPGWFVAVAVGVVVLVVVVGVRLL